MRFDIYESFIDGGGEHKMNRQQIQNVLTPDELKHMCSLNADEITKGNLKYWAEEAMNYALGIPCP